MKEEEYHRTIGKLSRAVVILSAIVIFLLITLVSLFAFKNPQRNGGCGVTEPVGICGGAIDDSPDPTPLFKNNCASCHFINRDMTGPAISGIHDRMPYEEWFFDYMLRQDSLIQVAEPYTMMLQKEWAISSWTHDKLKLNEEQVAELELLTY